MRSSVVGLSRPTHDLTDGGRSAARRGHGPRRAARDARRGPGSRVVGGVSAVPTRRARGFESRALFDCSTRRWRSSASSPWSASRDDDTPDALSVSDLSHPVVISALSLHPVWSDEASTPAIREFRFAIGSRFRFRAATIARARRSFRSRAPASSSRRPGSASSRARFGSRMVRSRAGRCRGARGQPRRRHRQRRWLASPRSPVRSSRAWAWRRRVRRPPIGRRRSAIA